VDNVVQLEMPMPVPGQRRDPVAVLDAQPPQRPRQLPRPPLQNCIAVPHDRTVALAGHDLPLRMMAGGMGQDAGNQHRL